LEITIDYEDLIYDIAGVYTVQNGCMLTCEQHSPREENWNGIGGDKKVLGFILEIILNDDDGYNTIDKTFHAIEDIVKYCIDENDDDLSLFIDDLPGWCCENDIPEDEDRVEEVFRDFIEQQQ
jgi:hypothetical protein